MKITFTFVEQPGDRQVEEITVRTSAQDTVTALQQALEFVQGITTIPVARIALDLPSAKRY